MFFLALVFLTITLRKKKGQTALERVRAQSISTNNKLNDACNECAYDACSNAQKLVQFFKFTNN